jgi:hypothetical protein
VRAQPVDATPSSQLIRQHFPMEKRLSDCNPNQTLARMVFRLNRRSRMTLSNGGPCKWISALCCVDPLRPPGKPDKCRTGTSHVYDKRVLNGRGDRRHPCARCSVRSRSTQIGEYRVFQHAAERRIVNSQSLPILDVTELLELIHKVVDAAAG